MKCNANAHQDTKGIHLHGSDLTYDLDSWLLGIDAASKPFGLAALLTPEFGVQTFLSIRTLDLMPFSMSTQLGTNHCTLTAMVSLSKDSLV